MTVTQGTSRAGANKSAISQQVTTRQYGKDYNKDPQKKFRLGKSLM